MFGLFGKKPEPVIKLTQEEIEATFASPTNILMFDLGKFIESFKFSARDPYVNAVAGSSHYAQGSVVAGMATFQCKRMAMDISDFEKAIWKVAAHLHAKGKISDNLMRDVTGTIAYHGGDCVLVPYHEKAKASAHYEKMKKAALLFANNKIPDGKEVLMELVPIAEREARQGWPEYLAEEVKQVVGR